MKQNTKLKLDLPKHRVLLEEVDVIINGTGQCLTTSRYPHETLVQIKLQVHGKNAARGSIISYINDISNGDQIDLLSKAITAIT